MSGIVVPMSNNEQRLSDLCDQFADLLEYSPRPGASVAPFFELLLFLFPVLDQLNVRVADIKIKYDELRISILPDHGTSDERRQAWEAIEAVEAKAREME